MSTLSQAAIAAITPFRILRFIATAAVALSLPAAAACADTLVYVKNGSVYVARADGSLARPVTGSGNGWAWPSETDGGIIAVAGGLSRISGSFNPSGSDEIYEFDQQGRQVGGPVATEGTYSTVSDPEYVTHFRVAPDNSNVAWTDIPSFTNPLTAWRNPNGSGSFSTANDSSFGGPLPYSSPEWWGSGHLLITHDGTTFGNAEYAVYSLADGSAPGWSDDEAIGNSPSYQVTIARSGLKFAVLTDDGPDNGGTIQNIAITLETTTTPPTSPSNVNDTHCSITLPASQFATNHGSSLASMSFSADGSTLAWGQDDGIYEANVSNPNDCATVQQSVHLVVPGGQMPFLGAAALSPAGTGSGHARKPVASFSIRPRHARARHALHFDGGLSHESGGRIVRYRWSFGDGTRSSSSKARTAHAFRRPGRYVVTLTVLDAAGRTATVKRRVTVHR